MVLQAEDGALPGLDMAAEAEKRLADLKVKYKHLLEVISPVLLRKRICAYISLFLLVQIGVEALVLACYWAYLVGQYPR